MEHRTQRSGQRSRFSADFPKWRQLYTHVSCDGCEQRVRSRHLSGDHDRRSSYSNHQRRCGLLWQFIRGEGLDYHRRERLSLSFIWSVEGSRQSIDSILRFTPDENDEVYVHLVLESASGCTIESEQFLPVLSQPDPSFSASTLFGIVPFEAKLKAASAEVDHLWTLNNTSLDSVTTVSPLIGEAGLHIVNLFVSDSNGCTSASSKTIRAYAGSIDLAILDVKEVSRHRWRLPTSSSGAQRRSGAHLWLYPKCWISRWRSLISTLQRYA